MLSLLQRDEDEPVGEAPSLRITARPEGGSVELEFVATTDCENLEDQLACLSDEIRLPEASEISLLPAGLPDRDLLGEDAVEHMEPGLFLLVQCHFLHGRTDSLTS